MKLKEFKETSPYDIPLGKLISIISKSHIHYLNHALKEYGINSTQLWFLFEIHEKNKINQMEIAKNCIINKGAVARSLKDLEDKELISREIDNSNRRQNKVFLTEKGKDTLFKIKKIIEKWDEETHESLDLETKKILHKELKVIALKAISINENMDKENLNKESKN